MCGIHMHIASVYISVNHYVLKAMINPHAVYVAMEDAAIENMFRAEYDLPCRPHPNVMRVLHHFCDSVPPRGLFVSPACRLYYIICLGLPNWPQFGGRRSLFLVMKEFNCNLQSHCRNLRERGSLDERFLLTVLLQLFKAIEHLVKHNILHRDLKMDNVLLKLEPNMTRSGVRLLVVGLCYCNSSVVWAELLSVTLDAAMRLLSRLTGQLQGVFLSVQVVIQPIILLSCTLSQLTPVLYVM